MNSALRPGGRVQNGKLQDVEGYAAVPVRERHQAHHRLDVHLDTVPAEAPLGVPQRPLDDPEQSIFRERLQDDDQRPGEQWADHFEGRILRGGTDKYHRARLDVRQKGVLLGLVEAMDFIHEQDRALALDDSTLLGGLDQPAQFRNPAGDGREGLEVGLGMRGNQAGEGGLARAGRSPEDQGRQGVLLDGEPKRPPRAEDVVLPDQLVERPWPHPIRQGTRRAMFFRFGAEKVHQTRIAEARPS